MFDLSAKLPADARGCVDELAELERLKSRICARQARLADRFDEETPRSSDRGTGTQVGLARRESPHRGRRLLSLARALLDDLPHTLAALERGDLNEHRAEIIAQESHDLVCEDRRELDRVLVGEDGGDVAGLGDTEIQLAAQRLVLRIDEAGAVRRRERAHARRRVTSRRLTDGQAQISAVVSDVHAAAIMGSLHERAGLEIALRDKTGDERGRAEVIADLFVARLTGQVTASSVPVMVDLVVSAETLLGDGDEPGDIAGHGPVPASVARKLAAASPEQVTRIRRLFADTDHLIAMESVQRGFDGLLRSFVLLRDQICRMPYCGARILHLDHVEPVADGGPTTALNGQGLCASCNLAKEEVGWLEQVTSGCVERHVVDITTPTGQHDASRAPAPPGAVRDSGDPPGWEQRRPGIWTLIA